MSYADELFVKMCRDILDNGTDTKGEKVRPKWEDTNESAYTIKRFGVVNRYDLRKEFPALTLRKTALKSCMDEILWIYQKKSNNVNDYILISGMLGQTKMVQLEPAMEMSWDENLFIKKKKRIRWITCFVS